MPGGEDWPFDAVRIAWGGNERLWRGVWLSERPPRDGLFSCHTNIHPGRAARRPTQGAICPERDAGYRWRLPPA